MNYDIDTPDGLENTKAWTEQHLDRISEGGIWCIPRNGAIYTIRHNGKTAFRLVGLDTPTERVLKAMGWVVK